MKILALDSSGMVASAAIAQDEILLAEYTVNYKKTHSQTLLPMVDEIVRMTELDLETVDYIAVAAGPGSFTGLRIGSATAKGLGLALNKPLIGVPTLEGLAYNLAGADKLVCPMMDARRSQVYTGIYRSKKEGLEAVLPQTAIGVEELIQKINQAGEPVILLGDGVPVYLNLLEKGLLVPFETAPLHLNRQRAASIAALGMIYAKEGRVETAQEHRPQYLRLSQAERERMAKEAAER
ncbi:MAG TPA: tRNA (adenosine(37)-N6)-threonylcarbamoyltransferase complex dimerization subunit type 1 TsaB [Candidatus Choladousia intestinigallinarum]|nr:tRNA (adenosine(37)-N6)-threonylcarbamoyltransferase complex dimerization subunit type 1 TsaB [Candidatus Choladousia intestinigallinarum]